MKYLDDIILFLSGDLNTPEEEAFIQKLETDQLLAAEYRAVRDIWSAMEDRLRLRPDSDTLSREEIIAEIEAEADLESYRRDTLSKRERRLKEKLEVIFQKRKFIKKRWMKGYFTAGLVAAATVAALIIFSNPPGDPDHLARKYYKPTREYLLIEQLQSAPRGKFARGYHYFAEEEFPEAKNAFEHEQEFLAYNNLAKLFYALSCFETGSKEASIIILENLSSSKEKEIRETSNWYLGLILLMDGQTDAGISRLEQLSKQNLHSGEAKRILSSHKRSTGR